MSGDYYAHVDRKYDEILTRLEALEKKVGQSKLMMKRHPEAEYERLVDVVVDHEKSMIHYNVYKLSLIHI